VPLLNFAAPFFAVRLQVLSIRRSARPIGRVDGECKNQANEVNDQQNQHGECDALDGNRTLYVLSKREQHGDSRQDAKSDQQDDRSPDKDGQNAGRDHGGLRADRF
jgi:hypothetical protein